MTLVVAYIVMASVAIVYIVRALAGRNFFLCPGVRARLRARSSRVPRACAGFFLKKNKAWEYWSRHFVESLPFYARIYSLRLIVIF